jgi:hypothetical protein
MEIKAGVWIKVTEAVPPPQIDALLWCDQGIVIGYHNGFGNWYLAPIEEEPWPWRLVAENVTHWMVLPDDPEADQGGVLGMSAWISVADRLPTEGEWCWVDWDGGGEPFPAVYRKWSSGGWTNEDCWEDFDKRVTRWAPIARPATDE